MAKQEGKSKKIVKSTMEETMHEFKQGDLESGKSGKKVKNPKQAIAIGLSEARRAGAKIPSPPGAKKAAKKASTKPAPKNSKYAKKTAKRS